MTQGKQSSLLLIERILLLKSLSIFQDTPETILAEIAHLMIDVHVQKNEQIVKEGEFGSCMYIILDGIVKVHKGNQLLAKLYRKDFFGELALLDTETRSASVTAETDCMLFRIDQESFYDMIESRPEVVKGVIKMLCKRIRAVNEQLIKLQK
ncbi:MAG: cyclic nucleotide-binding domain-containing protein [Bacteroidetes bacterium]|nr:MAG: cyclic nucleotide-binding domain-containing protein [Bacteroidota bacterium]